MKVRNLLPDHYSKKEEEREREGKGEEGTVVKKEREGVGEKGICNLLLHNLM